MAVYCPFPGGRVFDIFNLIELITGSSIAIEVAPEQLINTADHLKIKVTSIQNQMESMINTMDSMGGYWEGKTYDGRLSEFRQRIRYMEEVICAVNTYADKLQRIAENYINTENRNTESAGELPVSVIS